MHNNNNMIAMHSKHCVITKLCILQYDPYNIQRSRSSRSYAYWRCIWPKASLVSDPLDSWLGQGRALDKNGPSMIDTEQSWGDDNIAGTRITRTEARSQLFSSVHTLSGYDANDNQSKNEGWQPGYAYTNSFVTFLSWIYWLGTHAFNAVGHMGALL